jgi:putative DNA primase/helicase
VAAADSPPFPTDADCAHGQNHHDDDHPWTSPDEPPADADGSPVPANGRHLEAPGAPSHANGADPGPAPVAGPRIDITSHEREAGDRAPTLQGDPDAAIDFLRNWNPKVGWTVSAIDPKKADDIETFTYYDLNVVKALVNKHLGKSNLYFAVNRAGGALRKKPSKADITEVIGLHVDVDPRKGMPIEAERARILAALHAFEPAPTVIIDTGGGYSAFWKLREPIVVVADVVEQVELRNLYISRKLDGDHQCREISRIMRLPGTINLPTATKLAAGRVPTVSSVVEATWDRVYDLTDFPAAREAEPTKTRAKRETAARVVDIGVVTDAIGHVPADDYNVWLRFGMALKLDVGEPGFAIWDTWSQTCPEKYGHGGQRALRSKWISFKREDGDTVGIDYIFAQAREAGWTGGTEIAPAFSDEGLAQAFATEHENDLRFTNAWGKWNTWDGTRWRSDDTLAALDLARAHCRTTASRANKARTQTYVASAKASSAVVHLTRADRRIAMRVDQWDRDPWLLATRGGTVDLKTGITRPPDPLDYLTRSTRAAPGGKSDLWHSALHGIFAGDTEMIDFTQRLAGYCITGSVREEKVFLFFGDGGNGKGTVIETLGFVLGDYHTTVPLSTLLQTKHPEHPTEIAKLCGARLALASETQDGARWNAARIKLLSGGDRLTGRFMRQDYFDFDPTHKLIVSSNQKPMLGRVDQGIKRRMVLVPFTVAFGKNGQKDDEKLKAALREEAAGILAWAIEGCLIWQRRGLAIPRAVAMATDEYLHDQDDLTLWFDECCVLEKVPYGQEPTTRGLFSSFKIWFEENGGKAGSPKTFTQELEARGFVVRDRSNGLRHVEGIRVLPTGGEMNYDGPF